MGARPPAQSQSCDLNPGLVSGSHQPSRGSGLVFPPGPLAPGSRLVRFQRAVLHWLRVPWGDPGQVNRIPAHSLTLFTSRKNVRAFFPFPACESPLSNARLPPLPARPLFNPSGPRPPASSPGDVNRVPFPPSGEPTGPWVAMATAHNRKPGPRRPALGQKHRKQR